MELSPASIQVHFQISWDNGAALGTSRRSIRCPSIPFELLPPVTDS